MAKDGFETGPALVGEEFRIKCWLRCGRQPESLALTRGAILLG